MNKIHVVMCEDIEGEEAPHLVDDDPWLPRDQAARLLKSGKAVSYEDAPWVCMLLERNWLEGRRLAWPPPDHDPDLPAFVTIPAKPLGWIGALSPRTASALIHNRLAVAVPPGCLGRVELPAPATDGSELLGDYAVRAFVADPIVAALRKAFPWEVSFMPPRAISVPLLMLHGDTGFDFSKGDRPSGAFLVLQERAQSTLVAIFGALLGGSICAHASRASDHLRTPEPLSRDWWRDIQMECFWGTSELAPRKDAVVENLPTFRDIRVSVPTGDDAQDDRPWPQRAAETVAAQYRHEGERYPRAKLVWVAWLTGACGFDKAHVTGSSFTTKVLPVLRGMQWTAGVNPVAGGRPKQAPPLPAKAPQKVDRK